MLIGSPRERLEGEARVAMTPDSALSCRNSDINA